MERSTHDAPLMRAFDQAVRDSKKAIKDTPLSTTSPGYSAPSDPARIAQALRLKEEGNRLLVVAEPQDWAGAYVKFTLALAFDRSAAAAWCNRAWCGINRQL